MSLCIFTVSFHFWLLEAFLFQLFHQLWLNSNSIFLWNIIGIFMLWNPYCSSCQPHSLEHTSFFKYITYHVYFASLVRLRVQKPQKPVELVREGMEAHVFLQVPWRQGNYLHIPYSFHRIHRSENKTKSIFCAVFTCSKWYILDKCNVKEIMEGINHVYCLTFKL